MRPNRATHAEAQPVLSMAEIIAALEMQLYIASCVDDAVSPTMLAIAAALKALRPLMRRQAGANEEPRPGGTR